MYGISCSEKLFKNPFNKHRIGSFKQYTYRYHYPKADQKTLFSLNFKKHRYSTQLGTELFVYTVYTMVYTLRSLSFTFLMMVIINYYFLQGPPIAFFRSFVCSLRLTSDQLILLSECFSSFGHRSYFISINTQNKLHSSIMATKTYLLFLNDSRLIVGELFRKRRTKRYMWRCRVPFTKPIAKTRNYSR